jgi:hypothetical protein
MDISIMVDFETTVSTPSKLPIYIFTGDINSFWWLTVTLDGISLRFHCVWQAQKTLNLQGCDPQGVQIS